MMQNCDLPPPLKVFSGYDDKTVMASMNRICSFVGHEDERNTNFIYINDQGDKLELFKAFRLSQTRAREAEKKYEKIAKERDMLANALLGESLQVFAFRNRVKLLEVQVLTLKLQRKEEEKQSWCCNYSQLIGAEEAKSEVGDGGNNGGPRRWMIGFSICCLGIGGVGIAFGWRF